VAAFPFVAAGAADLAGDGDACFAGAACLVAIFACALFDDDTTTEDDERRTAFFSSSSPVYTTSALCSNSFHQFCL